MNPNDNNEYKPAEDENQGVMTKLTQGAEANNGIAQAEYMNPVTNQGPEPVKEEVNDRDERSAVVRHSGAGPLVTDDNGVNDDLLAEEDVEAGDVKADNQ